MEALVPAIADLLISSIPTIAKTISHAAPTLSSGNSSGESSAGVSMPAQALPQAPPPPIGSSLGSGGNCVTVPFQHHAATLRGTETNLHTVNINSIYEVRRHLEYFRDAELVTLDVIVFPAAGAYKIPVTVDLVWTPADVILNSGQVLDTPGSSRITVGGLNLASHATLACDLNYCNRILKSPIPYTNSPRLNIDFKQSKDAASLGVNGELRADIYIRGTIRLSHPVCTPGIPEPPKK